MSENAAGRKALWQDVGVGAVVAAFGALALINTFSMPESAVLFPRIVTGLLVLLGSGLTVVSVLNLVRGKYPEAAPVSAKTLGMPLVTFGTLIVYVVLISVLGFYSATVLFLVAFMRLMNIRSLKTIALTSGVLLAFIYLLFNVALKVRLPAGILL